MSTKLVAGMMRVYTLGGDHVSEITTNDLFQAIKEVSGQVNELDMKVVGLDERLTKVEDRLAKVEDRLTTVEEQVSFIKTEVKETKDVMKTYFRKLDKKFGMVLDELYEARQILHFWNKKQLIQTQVPLLTRPFIYRML